MTKEQMKVRTALLSKIAIVSKQVQDSFYWMQIYLKDSETLMQRKRDFWLGRDAESAYLWACDRHQDYLWAVQNFRRYQKATDTLRQLVKEL